MSFGRDCNPGDDILDSRDVEERFDDLESDLRQTYLTTCDEDEEGEPIENPPFEAWVEATSKDKDSPHALDCCEYIEYRDFIQECRDYVSDWRYGAQLIHETYFTDYARQFAEDIGALEGCDRWPATCIDWEQAARELKMDFSSIEFAGNTYYYR